MEALFRKIASKAKSTNECNIVHKVFDEFPPWCWEKLLYQCAIIYKVSFCLHSALYTPKQMIIKNLQSVDNTLNYLHSCLHSSLCLHTHTLVQTVTPVTQPGIGGEDFLSEQQKCLPLISVQRHWLNPFVSMSMPTNTSKSRWGKALVQISVDACRRV